jgi:hypothetical protein
MNGPCLIYLDSDVLILHLSLSPFRHLQYPRQTVSFAKALGGDMNLCRYLISPEWTW